MLATRFTELVGCEVPIQQAGMGALSPPALVAAVSNVGGLGMLGTARLGAHTVQAVDALLDEVQARTDRPFGVNFILAPEVAAEMDPGCIELAARRARVVEFFWSWPDPEVVARVHAQGALVSWQVGSTAEAVAAAEAGADLVVGQGIEAGGHVRGTVGVLTVLDEILAAVDVPVLAAGGIGTGRALAAVLAAGADGARVGTRFVAAEEAEAHPDYVAALIAADAEDTVYSRTFIHGWDAPGRVLRSCVTAAEAFADDFVGEVPSLDGSRVAFHRFEPDAITREATGAIEAMSLWAGESVGGVRCVETAAAILQELAGEAERLLRDWSDRTQEPTHPN
jgi:NAD(P)H-dependent flavin oxidoreductase YrpB (nitropropane dioxygenase family)